MVKNASNRKRTTLYTIKNLLLAQLSASEITGWGKKNGQSTILYYVRGLFFSWHPVEYLKSYLLTIFLLKNTTSN